MKALFVIIIFIWLFVGFLGDLHAKDNHVNYEMIIFMFFAPFIPLVAKMCGLV